MTGKQASDFADVVEQYRTLQEGLLKAGPKRYFTYDHFGFVDEVSEEQYLEMTPEQRQHVIEVQDPCGIGESRLRKPLDSAGSGSNPKIQTQMTAQDGNTTRRT